MRSIRTKARGSWIELGEDFYRAITAWSGAPFLSERRCAVRERTFVFRDPGGWQRVRFHTERTDMHSYTHV